MGLEESITDMIRAQGGMMMLDEVSSAFRPNDADIAIRNLINEGIVAQEGSILVLVGGLH